MQSLCIDQITLCRHIPQMPCTAWGVSTLRIDTKIVCVLEEFGFTIPYPANIAIPVFSQTYKQHFPNVYFPEQQQQQQQQQRCSLFCLFSSCIYSQEAAERHRAQKEKQRKAAAKAPFAKVVRVCVFAVFGQCERQAGSLPFVLCLSLAHCSSCSTFSSTSKVWCVFVELGD